MKSVCSNKISFSTSTCILWNWVTDCGKEPSLFSVLYVAMWNFDSMCPLPPLPIPLLCYCLCLDVKCYVWAGVKLRPFDVKVFGLSGSQVLLCLYLFHLLWHCSDSHSAGKDTTVAVHIELTAQPRKLCSSFHKVLMIQQTKQGLYLRITCGKIAVSLLESCMNVISNQSINRILFRIAQTRPPHPSSAERTAWPTLTWRGTGWRWPVTHNRHVGTPPPLSPGPVMAAVRQRPLAEPRPPCCFPLWAGETIAGTWRAGQATPSHRSRVRHERSAGSWMCSVSGHTLLFSSRQILVCVSSCCFCHCCCCG